jgi:cyanophycinase-like exopeptidase
MGSDGVGRPRILAIMGSGETAPTMARVHRALFERFGPGSVVPATLVDTPYGFQENADDLSERIVEYFRVSVGREMSVASYRSRDVPALTAATALARLGEARYVLSGPGSPSYALRHWVDGPIPAALAAKLAEGGVVTMASAAALTVGALTIPVYEIYKVGDEPTWLDGLDLLGPATGLRVAVVPHYDNAEGGNHDTRFCYIGERRLRVLERAMPADAFVLGVDSHTALVLDLEERRASVLGRGGVTVRAHGVSRNFPSGTETTVGALAEAAAEAAEEAVREGPPARRSMPGGGAGRRTTPPIPAEAGSAASFAGPLRDEVARIEGAFVSALADRDTRAAVDALLALDATIERRVGAGEDSPDLEAARATFRSLIVRLGDLAAVGARDPRDTVEPFVTALLELRTKARAAGDWATADLVRDRLVGAGIEVRDEVAGSSWVLHPGEPG